MGASSLFFSMNAFDKLPVELCDLISKFSVLAQAESLHGLYTLTRLSKRNYAIFNPFLYRILDNDALRVLAASQASRIPLASPHPASFVKELKLEYNVDEDHSEEEMRKSLKTFRKDVGRAMANMIAHAFGDAPGLQVFWIDCAFLSFPELLGKVDFSVFTRLRDVAIRCEFPKANIKKCLKMLVCKEIPYHRSTLNNFSESHMWSFFDLP